jgi:hypothetical protein
MFLFKKKEKRIKAEPVSLEDEDEDDDVNKELYRRGDVISFPIGSDESLVYCRSDRQAKILPTFIASLLPYCSSFNTLEAHAQACVRSLRLDQQQIDHIHDSLFVLAEAGFLTSISSARELIQERPSENELHKIATVGFVTHNRRESLRRGVLSYIENVKRYHRECDFVVVDSNPSPSDRTQTAEMLRTLSGEHRVPISYAGFDEKASFADILINEFEVPHQVVNFALLGPEGFNTYTGANRNALLLHTIGDRFFSADDDTMCNVYEVPERIDGLTFFSEEPMEGWFFQDRATALQSVRPIDEDAISIHERWLGKELSGVGSIAQSHQIDYASLSIKYFKDLTSGTGKIVATLPGIIGDSGIESPRWFLLSGDTRERLCHSNDQYDSAFSSREMLRAVRRINVGRAPSVMTTALGLDNRELLPPFFPVLRNQDSIFAVTLVKCFDSYYLCHLPCALLHAPLAARNYRSAKTTSSCGMSDILRFCIKVFESGFLFLSPEERLLAMGRHLMNFGAMPPSDFEEFIRIQFWEEATRLINMAEELLQSYEYSPDFWVKDVEAYSQNLRNALLLKESLIPFDLKEQTNTEAPLLLAQQLIYQFGELLYCWPEIVKTAKQLRSQGRRIAVRVE